MTFGWINNSGAACGGTMRCSIDMIRALPDAKHHLCVLNSGMDPRAEQELTELGVSIANGLSFASECDVLVCQNTHRSNVPSTRAKVIYYAHSVNSTARNPPKQVDAHLCVSGWLAAKLGWSADTVLYQPVSIPPWPDASWSRDPTQLIIGRICTPTPKKWVWEEFYPYFANIVDVFPHAKFEFVGAPKAIERRLRQECPAEHLAFAPASPQARSLLHEWDILLYTSGTEESFGRVVREAQRCACYPIVSDRGGFVEQIDVGRKTDPGAGHLVRDPSEVVEVIRKWDRDREGLGRLCQEVGDRFGSLQAWRTGFLDLLGKL